MTVAARVLVAPIRAYRGLASPLFPRRCKYHPTCSQYAVDAITSYGAIRGLVLAAWRLLRCNPFSNGGVDYVHQQRLFAPRAARSH